VSGVGTNYYTYVSGAAAKFQATHQDTRTLMEGRRKEEGSLP